MKLLDNGTTTLDGWFKNFPPMGGEKQWKDGRSAKELARYVTSALPHVPSEMEAILSHFTPSDAAFSWAAEYVTDLASHDLGRGEGRNHDAMLVNEDIFVGVEGKADESLGSQYIGTALADASENKKHRIRGMIRMLYGDLPEEHVDIRYQLVTAACATLLEAKERGLRKAMLMVVVFKKDGCYSEEKVAANAEDVRFFLAHSKAVDHGDYWCIPTVYGQEHGIDLYFSEIVVDLP